MRGRERGGGRGRGEEGVGEGREREEGEGEGRRERVWGGTHQYSEKKGEDIESCTDVGKVCQ